MSLLQQDEPLPAKRIVLDQELAFGQVVEFRYPTDEQPCLLMRLQDGRLVAYGQQCSHLSCAVIPDLEAGHLRCPCHNGYFEIQDGRPIAGPPRRPLIRIRIEVREGIIFATGVELRTV
jgi:nitrite reductase/ring-hydroxylating ferredoxin subunit